MWMGASAAFLCFGYKGAKIAPSLHVKLNWKKKKKNPLRSGFSFWLLHDFDIIPWDRKTETMYVGPGSGDQSSGLAGEGGCYRKSWENCTEDPDLVVNWDSKVTWGKHYLCEDSVPYPQMLTPTHRDKNSKQLFKVSGESCWPRQN